MLKRITNNYSNIKKREAEDIYYCTPYLDCTARDTAQAAVEAAQTAYDNAVALRDSLKTEMDNVQQLVNDYKAVYDKVATCGSSVNSPGIMGNESGLSSLISCACTYGNEVESAYNNCVTEVSKCSTELTKAKTTLANTPCVWRCG
jgi:exonuclease VII small subunit